VGSFLNTLKICDTNCFQDLAGIDALTTQ